MKRKLNTLENLLHTQSQQGSLPNPAKKRKTGNQSQASSQVTEIDDGDNENLKNEKPSKKTDVIKALVMKKEENNAEKQEESASSSSQDQAVFAEPAIPQSQAQRTNKNNEIYLNRLPNDFSLTTEVEFVSDAPFEKEKEILDKILPQSASLLTSSLGKSLDMLKNHNLDPFSFPNSIGMADGQEKKENSPVHPEKKENSDEIENKILDNPAKIATEILRSCCSFQFPISEFEYLPLIKSLEEFKEKIDENEKRTSDHEEEEEEEPFGVEEWKIVLFQKLATPESHSNPGSIPKNSKIIANDEILTDLIKQAFNSARIRLEIFSAGLTSLYNLFVSGFCPYFYIIGDRFSAIFIASGVEKQGRVKAIVSNSTEEFRKELVSDGIKFFTAKDLDDLRRKGAKNQKLPPRSHEKEKNMSQVLILQGRARVHKLFDKIRVSYPPTLRNFCGFEFSGSEKTAKIMSFSKYDVPKLVAPVQFLNSCLMQSKISLPPSFRKSNSLNTNQHVLLVQKGLILPHNLGNLFRAVQKFHFLGNPAASFAMRVKDHEKQTALFNQYVPLAAAMSFGGQSQVSSQGGLDESFVFDTNKTENSCRWTKDGDDFFDDLEFEESDVLTSFMISSVELMQKKSDEKEEGAAENQYNTLKIKLI